MQESTISMILGVLVVLVVGGFVIQYLTKNKTQETLPDLTIQEVTPLPTTHKVADGESLWSISEQYYGTGYNWVDIKEANSITNADELSEGQELSIPYVTPRVKDERENSRVAIVNEPTEVVEQSKETVEISQEQGEAITTRENKDEKTKTEYTITKGDSLWKIAEKYYNDGNKWIDIAKANNLDNPSLLTSNKTLVIPNVLAAEETVEQKSPTEEVQEVNAVVNTTKYTVEPGDSLWSIAQSVYGDGDKWIEIAKANNLSHPSVIHHGNELTIPR